MFRKFIVHSKKFGLKYAVIETLALIDYKIGVHLNIKSNGILRSMKHNFVHDWLVSYLAPVTNQYQRSDVKATTLASPTSTRVWVCWLQGIDSAPQRIQTLVNRIYEMAGGRTVVMLTEANIREYCELPDNIWRKYEDGVITRQQLTDIVRCAVLSSWGGLWVDSTLLITAPIPDSVFSSDIWCVKGLNAESEGAWFVPYFSEWQSYFIASKPHSVTYRYLYDALIYYWNNMDANIDYFLVFYIAKIARETIPFAKEEYESVPNNNENCEMLAPKMLDSRRVKAEKVKQFFKDTSTYVYKLSWRARYKSRSDATSFYDWVCRLFHLNGKQ